MIVQRGKLIIGTKDELPGIGFLNPQTGKYEGFSVDLADDLATRLFGAPGHLDARGVTTATRVPTVQEGTVDMNIETTFITKARKEQVDFSEPYWGSGTRIFVRADDTTIHGPEDLVGKTVAVTKGSSGEQTLKDYPGITFIQFDTIGDTIEAIRAGRAVATDFDEGIGLSFMKQTAGFKFVGKSLDYYYYGIMVKKSQPEWLAYINQWLRQIKTNGTWKRLFAKNFPGVPVPDPPMPPYDKAFY